MTNFKAGDFAIIVGAVNTPENIGRVVTLELFVPANSADVDYKGRLFASGASGRWIVSADGLLSFCTRADGESFKRNTGMCIIRENFLMPLKGDPDQLKDDESEPIKRSSGVPA